MKRIFIFLLFLLSCNIIAQVGGISGSKLGTYSADVIGNHVLEFEPTFSFSKTGNFWNNSGGLVSLYHNDSVNVSSEFAFRITYGLWSNFEIGMVVPSNMEWSSWGVKYIFTSRADYSLGVIAGLNVPLGNRVHSTTNAFAENTSSIGGGLISSFNFSENMSFDFNTQYFSFIKKTTDGSSGSLFINADLGYYLFEKELQLITGFGFESHNHQLNQYKLTFYPGATIETGKNYIIVLGIPIDVLGKNTEQSIGFNLALTLTFN